MSLLILLVAVLQAPCLWAESKPVKELTVYTSRKTHLVEPLFQAYSKKAGVKIKHVNNKAGVLIQKIKQEGGKTPADVLITVDAGNLGQAASLGLFAPITQKSILDKVSPQDRGDNNQWVGLSLRARTIFYNTDKVKKSELKSYADLGDKKWKGRLCLRTSRKVYNQSLVASLIDNYGEKEAKKIVKGWVDNLAMPVFTSDTLLLEAVDSGKCQVGIANTYYLARLVKKGKAKKVSVFWPTKANGGVHVNVSGVGVIKASHNKKEALAFIQWLLSDESQKILAGLNDEYPVVKNLETSEILKKWGGFSREKTALGNLAPLQKKAVMIMDSAQYR